MTTEQDFGTHYLEFYPTFNGLNSYGHQDISQVCIDGFYTAAQLRNIANELDRLEAMGREDNIPEDVPDEAVTGIGVPATASEIEELKTKKTVTR